MLVSSLFTLCICCVAVIGDKILETAENGVFRAISDSLTHGLIGVLSWAIVVVRGYYTRHYICSKRFEVILCGALASFLDLDHFISAKSWHMKDAVSLKKRPFLHCTTLWIGFYCIFIYWAKVANSGELARLGTLVLTAGLSHHLRDGVRRGLWLFPFGHTLPLQRSLYLGGLALLPYFVLQLLPQPPHYYTPIVV